LVNTYIHFLFSINVIIKVKKHGISSRCGTQFDFLRVRVKKILVTLLASKYSIKYTKLSFCFIENKSKQSTHYYFYPMNLIFKKYLFFGIFITLFQSLSAQIPTILEGQIRDYRLQPLKRVKVMIDGLNGISPTYTNSEGKFLMQLPKDTQITNQTPFIVNGVEVNPADVMYSSYDHFVQIHTHANHKKLEKRATRQHFMVRVRDKYKDPINHTRVSVNGTYYYTDDNGEFMFLITTEGIHQVDIVHQDSLQLKPRLKVQLPEKQKDKEYFNPDLDQLKASLQKNRDSLIKYNNFLQDKLVEIMDRSQKSASSKADAEYIRKLQGTVLFNKQVLQEMNTKNEDLLSQIDSVVSQKDSVLQADQAKAQHIVHIEKEKREIQQAKQKEAHEFQRKFYILILIVIGLLLSLYVSYQILQKIKSQNRKIQLQAVSLRQANEKISQKNQQLENNRLMLTDRTGQLAKRTAELENTLQKLRNTQSQLIQSEKMAGLGTLTAGIAHEINNPVGFIYGGVESLEERLPELWQISQKFEALKSTTPETKLRQQLQELEHLKQEMDYEDIKTDIAESVTDIKIGADRTFEIVKSLRTFSRLDEGKYKTIDIHENIESTLIILKNQYKHHVKIEKNYSNIPNIECSPGSINQVIMNILANAIQAIKDNNKENGNIIISTGKVENTSDPTIFIAIKDDGPGIPKNVKHRIFDPFFTTKDVGKGTGLGLSISMNIIKAHHGKLYVATELGKGTEFMIHLPIKQKGIS